MPADAHKRMPDGSVKDVPLSELAVDDKVLVKPGEKTPAGGAIVEGESSVNEAMLTGDNKATAKWVADQGLQSQARPNLKRTPGPSQTESPSRLGQSNSNQTTKQPENIMQIQINTDHNIAGHEALAARVRGVVESAVGRFSDHITRVEVHLTDEVSHKSGQNDKRCVMEARLEGRQPIAVTHHAGSVHQAVDGAADKLTRLVESTIERLRDQRRHAADPSHREPQEE